MSGTLRILIWPDYVNPENVKRFESETGLAVELDEIPSAVELMQKVRAGGQYDVIVPPDYTVRELIAENRLLPLDQPRLPNLKNIDSQLLNGRAHDPETRYSIPKDWGTTGFMFREDKIIERPTSWRDFWDLAPGYPGKVSVLDSPGEVIGAALKMRGHSYNSMKADHLRQAYADIRDIKAHVRFETNYRPALASGEVWLSLGWNGDAFALKSKGVPVRYVIPSEGSQKWEDDWVIPANAPHADAAYQFIDFMLRRDVALKEAHYTGYATPNQAALEALDNAARSDPSIYPPTEIMDRLEWGLPSGEDGPVERDFSMIG